MKKVLLMVCLVLVLACTMIGCAPASIEDARLEVSPTDLETIQWPQSEAGQQIPVPKSTIGKFESESNDSFMVYIGETTKEDYDQYVTACKDAGFVVDPSEDETYYYAQNDAGWVLNLEYRSDNIMVVSVDVQHENGYIKATTTAPAENK